MNADCFISMLSISHPSLRFEQDVAKMVEGVDKLEL